MKISTFIVALFASLSLWSQEGINLNIISFQTTGSRILMVYEETGNVPAGNVQLTSSASSPNTSVWLPEDLTVYLFEERIGLIRMRLKDLVAKGPSSWRDIPFQLFFEGQIPVKLKQVYVPN